MRSVLRTSIFSAAALLFCAATHPLFAQAGDPVAAIQQKLQERIVLAALDANGEIVTAGSVVTLQKGQLQMCATTSPAVAGAPVNTYKGGKLSAGMFSWNLGLGLMKIDPSTIPMHTSVPGEKFWIVAINVKKNGAQFKIWTDPDSNNFRYWTWLVLPFDKKQAPSPEEVLNTLAEVLAVEPNQNQAAQGPAAQAPIPTQDGPPPPIAGEYAFPGGPRLLLLSDGSFTKFVGSAQGHGQYSVDGVNITLTYPSNGFSQHFTVQSGSLLDVNTQQSWSRTGDAPTAPAPAPFADIAPPPTPPAAPPPTISLGQTSAQVTAGFGQPLKVAHLGAKTVFYYKDMKVTFTGGKVSDVE